MPSVKRKRGPRAPTYVQKIKKELKARAKQQKAALSATQRDLTSLGCKPRSGSSKALKACRRC